MDTVFDAVGAATCADDIKVLRPFGTLVSFGRASGAPIDRHEGPQPITITLQG